MTAIIDRCVVLQGDDAPFFAVLLYIKERKIW